MPEVIRSKLLKARRRGLSPEMDRMNSIDTVRVLNRIARKYYHDDVVTYDHAGYIRECFACLQKFFATELSIRRDESDPESAFENGYLFSAMTYKSEGNKKIALVTLTDSKDDLGYYFVRELRNELSTLFDPIIENLYDDIYAGRSISITEALLKDKKKGKDLYLHSGQPYKAPVDPGDPPRDVDARISFFCTSDLDYSAGDSRDHFTEKNFKPIEEFRVVLTDGNNADPYVTNEGVGTLLWHYRQLQEAYLADRHGQEFVVHFIRPSFIEFGYNILLSLGTNHRLDAEQLAFIYLLVHKIVSQTVIERTKETERLKRKKSYSLTSHSFKTELSTTFTPQVNMVADAVAELNLPLDSKLIRYVDELSEQSKSLFRLTGLISLIDKIDKKADFIDAGHRDELISPESERVGISEYCALYNSRHRHQDDIVVDGDTFSAIIVKVFDEFLSGQLIRLFYKTLFENLILHGRRDSDNKIHLKVSQKNNLWRFKNYTRENSFAIDEKKLTGNLSLFKTFIEETGSGKLQIESDQRLFTVTYQSGETNGQD